MSIRAGQILHDADGFVIDRIQQAGVGNVNIPEEKIYELGNFESVGTVRDIPDLSFDVESFDVSTELEALITGADPTAVLDGDEFDFANYQPLNILSPFKSANNAYDIIRGVAVPYLTLERSTYRFGLRANATQQHTFRGDSIFYVPGTPYFQEFTNTGAGTYNFDNTAIVYELSGDDIFALSVHLYDSTSGMFRRLFLGADYTNTDQGITLLADESSDYDTIAVVYGSTVAATYPQSGVNPEGNTVHEGSSVKPSAVRSKDIDVYIGDQSSTPVFTRWNDVQSFEVTRSVNLENDEEFGNAQFVDTSYDVADVTGSIGIKPRTPEDLFSKIHEIADVAEDRIIGPYTSATIPVELRISDPDSGNVLKTLYVPDARFTVPGIQGRVQTKLETTFSFTSDSGTLLVYEGLR